MGLPPVRPSPGPGPSADLQLIQPSLSQKVLRHRPGMTARLRLEANTVEFWFMMQIAMLCSFATAYPVNWWLIRSGFEERDLAAVRLDSIANEM